MEKSHIAGVFRSHSRLLSLFLALCAVFSLIGESPAYAEAVTSDTASAPYASISGNITVPQGKSITFTITGDAYFVIGTSGVIKSCMASWIGDQYTYGIDAVGEPGSSTGLYLVAPGQEARKFCVITVGPPEETTPPPKTPTTQISYSDNYYDLRFKDLKQNEMMYSEIAVSDPEVSLSIASNNDGVIQATPLQKIDNRPGHYMVALYAVGQGYTTLTITASDGTIDNMPVIVRGVIDKDYTLTSDTNQDFTIAQNGSYFMKVNYTYQGPTDDPTARGNSIGGGGRLSIPLLVSDNPNIQVTLVTHNGSEFLFRIDAFGAVGQSATLYTGSYNYRPEKLCRVTISSAPKNIRLDTTGLYQCDPGDSYRFVAYTNSPTPPAAGSDNSHVSVQYVRKVDGGYEYRMTAQPYESDGYSQVQVTSGSETVSFPVLIDYTFFPSVESDTHQTVRLAKGESYTYKFTIMGGGEPTFTGGYNAASTTPIITVQLVKKDGSNYYVKVTALSDKIGDEAYVYIQLLNSRYYDPNSITSYGTVQIKPDPSAPVIPMKSDTTSSFTLAQNKFYTFKITGAPIFKPDHEDRFRTELIRKSGNDYYYRILPAGFPGQTAEFSMSNGITTQRVCNVTIGALIPVVMKSDTTQNFSLTQGKSYTFKITGATGFNPGTLNIFKTELVKRSGSDSYYKITAIGPVGSSAGMYMGVADQPVQKVCVVSITELGSFLSDTTSNFTIPLGKNYTFKITAQGAKTVALTAGTGNTFRVVSSKRDGNDFYFTISACDITSMGKSSGVYVSVDGLAPKKICVVTLGVIKLP
ncbi:hypothetical protein [Clostridium sp. KNHs216]|uniref:hypothetical protein n=1 Tax=Clostridium sp. KNHs216 TaxID=1550235 RepID=UPI00115072DB|nr:hypothetical protein [Clostridium sp. KNHs216]TQI66120.1 hypothetical protein LY85_0778 [Clostridium sp. KNHs216]